MFHVVMCADENYMKYAAVLITSIVKSTDTTKRFNEFQAFNMTSIQTENTQDTNMPMCTSQNYLTHQFDNITPPPHSYQQRHTCSSK